jgi:ABC-type multidrug transport system ATPase subunit
MILSIQNLTKQYGKKLALNDVSLTLEPGIYGLLGPNGAGKTTLMNIIVGNLAESSGLVAFDGEDIHKMGKRFRALLGYMPQQQSVYERFSGQDFLLYMAALKGVRRREMVHRVKEVSAFVNMKGSLKYPMGEYSGGMKQRILIAAAIINKPNLLILDEPTAGLDPKERIRIRNLISKIALDKIVIIATHVVSDVEHIAKEVILLNRGTVLRKKETADLIQEIGGRVYEIVAPIDLLPKIEHGYKTSNISGDGRNVCVKIISERPPLGYEYRAAMPTLEDAYLYFFDEGFSDIGTAT